MNAMPSPAITTIVKMVESLPNELQAQVVEHVRAYLEELAEEQRWDTSFKQTESNLLAAARQAKAEIAAELSLPMDYEQL
jgi:gamma-glutamyl:cysteine ligase YbdK (ATP-grasp superfamily)